MTAPGRTPAGRPPVTRDALRDHLLRTRLAGPEVPTPRQNNLRHYRLFAQADPKALMGLDPERRWDEAAVLAMMAARVGVDPDPRYTEGPDTIDPERTLDALDRLAALLRATADARGTVLAGTGHPQKLPGFHGALVRALEAAGCRVHAPVRGLRFREPTPEGERGRITDAVGAVTVIRDLDGYPEFAAGRSGGARGRGGTAAGELRHTHSPQPVRLTLAALADAGHPPPDLVLGDHGWLCGAGRLGIPAGGLADCNDVAPFAAEEEGTVAVVVPVDDGSAPACYGPLSDYVLQRADLAL